jgi:WD40 repeat protein
MLVLDTQAGPINSLAFAPGGRLLGVVKQTAQGVALWDLAEQKLKANLVTRRSPFRLVFAPDGRTAVVGQAGRGATATLWHLETYQEAATLTNKGGYLAALAYTPDSGHLVTVALTHASGTTVDIRRWDLKTYQSELSGQCQLRSWRWNLSLLVGDKVSLAVGGWVGAVTICSPGKRNVQVALPERRALAQPWFSPDGRTLAVLRDRTVRLWDVKAKQVRASWKEGRKVLALAFAPDSRLLAVGGNEGAVKFRDVATGKERAGFDWQVGAVNAVAFSPDGMLAAAGGDNGKVVVWDVDQT